MDGVKFYAEVTKAFNQSLYLVSLGIKPVLCASTKSGSLILGELLPSLFCSCFPCFTKSSESSLLKKIQSSFKSKIY